MKEYITKENKASLEAELRELSGPKRKEIITALEYAKSLGDLSENAEYHSAREAQGQLQERISTIENVLNHAIVVDHVSDGLVNIGSTVVIQKDGEPNTRTFVIVGSEETKFNTSLQSAPLYTVRKKATPSPSSRQKATWTIK
jgi:transcription elongation factor GreA